MVRLQGVTNAANGIFFAFGFFFFPDGFYLFFLLLAMGKISAEAH